MVWGNNNPGDKRTTNKHSSATAKTNLGLGPQMNRRLFFGACEISLMEELCSETKVKQEGSKTWAELDECALKSMRLQ